MIALHWVLPLLPDAVLGEIRTQRRAYKGWELTDLIGDGFEGSFVPGNNQNVETLLGQLNRVFPPNAIRGASDD